MKILKAFFIILISGMILTSCNTESPPPEVINYDLNDEDYNDDFQTRNDFDPVNIPYKSCVEKLMDNYLDEIFFDKGIDYTDPDVSDIVNFKNEAVTKKLCEFCEGLVAQAIEQIDDSVTLNWDNVIKVKNGEDVNIFKRRKINRNNE